jgi:1-aminocyclopropane-1-carboxylate deaminase/D-cysteine desulfhydrase-like pyridoxal-dependent ACC family enzyme
MAIRSVPGGSPDVETIVAKVEKHPTRKEYIRFSLHASWACQNSSHTVNVDAVSVRQRSTMTTAGLVAGLAANTDLTTVVCLE